MEDGPGIPCACVCMYVRVRVYMCVCVCYIETRDLLGAASHLLAIGEWDFFVVFCFFVQYFESALEWLQWRDWGSGANKS